MVKYSVAVLSYNSKLESLLLTLRSVISQKIDYADIEIIMADDGSRIHYYAEAKAYLESRGFYNFNMLPVRENVGTVRNIAEALKYCHGKYIKLIGAGDLLFDDTTLKDVFEYMEKNECDMCFGLMRGYYYDKDKMVQKAFTAPKVIDIYRKSIKWEKLKRNILIYGDWISGASMFFEKKVLSYYLEQMVGKVVYCEDLLTANLILDRRKIGFFDKSVVWYQMGSGITTSNSSYTFLEKVRKDQKNYYLWLIKEYPDQYCLKRGLRLMSTGRFLKYFFEPMRIIHVVDMNLQKKKRKHLDNNKGFLDFWEGVNL